MSRISVDSIHQVFNFCIPPPIRRFDRAWECVSQTMKDDIVAAKHWWVMDVYGRPDRGLSTSYTASASWYAGKLWDIVTFMCFYLGGDDKFRGLHLASMRLIIAALARGLARICHYLTTMCTI
jgi:hypothetical protein